MDSSVVHYLLFQDQTVFVPLRHVYAECSVLIEGEPQLSELICLRENCHRDKNCMNTLVHRIHQLFDEAFPEARMMLLYFRAKNRPNSIQAGVFHRDMREPSRIVCNPFAFRKFLREGVPGQWHAPMSFHLPPASSATILPVESLIRKP